MLIRFYVTQSIMKFIIIFITIISLLTSCGIYRPTDARKVSPDAKKRVKKNLEEGKGFRISTLGKEILIFSLLAQTLFGELVLMF
jgi:hypothetical protein